MYKPLKKELPLGHRTLNSYLLFFLDRLFLLLFGLISSTFLSQIFSEKEIIIKINLKFPIF